MIGPAASALAGRSTADILLGALLGAGWRDFTGVPCSYLAALLEAIAAESEATWIPAVREDAAVAVATGMALADRQCAVLMQNSGLGYSLNILTSLNLVYGVPLLLVVSWRGNGPDAVEHEVMGRRLVPLLDAVGVESAVFDPDDPPSAVRRAAAVFAEGRTVALLIGASL